MWSEYRSTPGPGTSYYDERHTVMARVVGVRLAGERFEV